jgi:hypothetical protein
MIDPSLDFTAVYAHGRRLKTLPKPVFTSRRADSRNLKQLQPGPATPRGSFYDSQFFLNLVVSATCALFSGHGSVTLIALPAFWHGRCF